MNVPMQVGPFEVTFVPSAHSRLLLGLAVPMDGDITCEHLDDLTAAAYGCGQVYGIHIRVGGATLYHQGSAEIVDDAVQHRRVDVFLAGISGRGFSRRYLERAARWDDAREAALEKEIGDEITRAVGEAERAPPPERATLFTDVYADVPWNLREQMGDPSGMRRG